MTSARKKLKQKQQTETFMVSRLEVLHQNCWRAAGLRRLIARPFTFMAVEAALPPSFIFPQCLYVSAVDFIARRFHLFVGGLCS
jgi:hypothetical protein